MSATDILWSSTCVLAIEGEVLADITIIATVPDLTDAVNSCLAS